MTMAFNGDLGIYHAWKRSLHLYMAFNTSKFPDDETKVACALTYMTSGSANNWAQAFYESALDPVVGTLTLGTWADFLTKLDETFNDPNAQRKAMDSLLRDKLDIDKDGPEAFFATYEINARKANLIAGTAANDAIHINNVTRLMPFDIQTRIGYMPTPATTYSTLKTAILQMYASYKERKDRVRPCKHRSRQSAREVSSGSTGCAPGRGNLVNRALMGVAVASSVIAGGLERKSRLRASTRESRSPVERTIFAGNRDMSAR